MGGMNDAEDADRKMKNTVIDKAENAAGITKSPKELAKRIIEYLTHREYKEAAVMLSSEARKHLVKKGLENDKLAQEKLVDFERAVNALAIDLKNHDYKQIMSQFERLEKVLPEKSIESYPVLSSMKNILNSIIDTFKKHIEEGTEPEFKDMLSTLEKSFDNFMNN